MMSLIYLSLIYASTNMINSTNPVKATFVILVTSTMAFLMMEKMSGTSWMPLIFYILFMGGVLILFMILSSLFPNEPSKKLTISTMLSVTALFLTLKEKSSEFFCQQMGVKEELNSNETICVLILVVMFYFLTFLEVLSKKKYAMRTLSC